MTTLTKASRWEHAMSTLSDEADAPARKIECVCPNCLHSVMIYDSKPIPRCLRCNIRMIPDDFDIPRAYSSRGPSHPKPRT